MLAWAVKLKRAIFDNISETAWEDFVVLVTKALKHDFALRMGTFTIEFAYAVSQMHLSEMLYFR